MTKTIFVAENEDEFEVIEHTDIDSNNSIELVLNTSESESYINLPLHRNVAIKLAMKIIETLK